MRNARLRIGITYVRFASTTADLWKEEVDAKWRVLVAQVLLNRLDLWAQRHAKRGRVSRADRTKSSELRRST